MPRILLLSNPRSGSNYLQDLLNCHPEIELLEELLNEEKGFEENPLKRVKDALSDLDKTYVGFKLFPEQLYAHKLHFGELVNSTGITHIVVLWREELLEGFTSREIAYNTDEWYSTTKSNAVRKVKIEPSQFQEYIEKLTIEWARIGKEWPVDARPIFVKFEELIKRPTEEVKRVLAEMSIPCSIDLFITPSERQNPAPIQEKVVNYHEIESGLREKTLNVDKILLGMINVSLQIPKELLHFAPDREPCMPAEGWKYRVAEPYLPAIAKQNAFDAIQSGSISSAGYWPRELSKRLRSLFRCPVAQPCSNGFTALLLAMQAAGIGEGDVVLVPTMTMVAVANAVYYLRATPIFADNAKDGYNPTWKEYEEVATDKTKAVVVTHTYGVPVPDIEVISRECRSRGWVLIEDISECVGISCITLEGQQQLLGTFGDYAIASLYANKIVHGGDGGFVVAKEARIGKKLASIVNHGFTPSFHFVHFEQAPNAKIHGIGAAIASGCLDELHLVMEHRSRMAKWYRQGLGSGLPLVTMPESGFRDTPWVFGVQCKSKEERTALRAFLASHGIETRDYFFCLHLQPAYLNGINSQSLPNAEVLGSTGFYLPTHTNLKEEDVNFICSVVRAYFSSASSQPPPVVPPKRSMSKEAAQIEPDGFAIQVRKYRDTGELVRTISRGHIYLEAVKLGLEAEESLVREGYGQIHVLLDSMKNVLERSQQSPNYNSMEKYFGRFISYFESQKLLHQPINRPWLQIDLNCESYNLARNIPTTTDPETLQLLVWLIQQHKPKIMWEIGSWMGHATALMAQTCSSLGTSHNAKIFACDAFMWQEWMNSFWDNNLPRQNEKSFLELFKANLNAYASLVQPVKWPYDISKLPELLETAERPQFIYLDITQDDEDLEEIWALIKKSLIPNETIILFNGLTHTSIPFFTRHAKQLKAIAKPATIAKAFLFFEEVESVQEEEEYEEKMKKAMHLKKTVKFHNNPGWDHHHDNLFCKSIDLLRQNFHSDEAEVVFIPAVEETLCDEPEVMFNQPWIGIIHSVETHPEFFYAPDLQRICTRRRYLAAMKNCKGLFTLTSFQAKYLDSHLPSSLPKFPIQHLYYPIELKKEVESGFSAVPQMMRDLEFPIQLVHVGSFARDFDFFFETPIPSQFCKVLVAGDDTSKEASHKAPSDVIITERLSEHDYEKKLKTCIVFLTLKYEGAANTLILECIARNVPILTPKLSSCIDYLGKDYPLLYDPQQMPQLDQLLTLENIEKAINYLEGMDKSKFTYQKFVSDIENGAVMLAVPPPINPVSLLDGNFKPAARKYDVTISLCSYKRTHHLPKILEALWENQDFTGTYEIIIWNNNDCTGDLVQQYTRKYIERSTAQKSMEVISSTENHYCSIRFAMASLMKGQNLLICDDDVIPGRNFISFFHSAHQKHPKDVLCVRGHVFLPHKLDMLAPRKVWMEYDNLQFQGDDKPEQLIHFVHADACLIPKSALQEVASVPMPDQSFVLVDDYWMSFVLSHKFNRKLRKLSTAKLSINPIERTDDSDTVGLALHTRPEVQDARLRLYMHHMLEGWPSWISEERLSEDEEKLVREQKGNFWNGPAQIGYNIHSELDDEGIEALAKTGAGCVRIGAVGVGEQQNFELSGFLTEPEEQLKRLEILVGKLSKRGIVVVLTLERRLASPQTWKLIAQKFATYSNVVGYDLINEPFTEKENEQHWTDIADSTSDQELQEVVDMQKEMIQAIRKVDKMTPIILEPTFWGQPDALIKYPIDSMLPIDDNLLVSFHFYQPMLLTCREQNKGRYSFPCSIPWFDNVEFSEETFWNEEAILTKFEKAKSWAESKGVGIFLGEFGIARDIGGAPEYLGAVINACKKVGMTGLLFSFRDPEWEAMDYELGQDVGNCFRIYDEKENAFTRIINKGMGK